MVAIKASWRSVCTPFDPDSGLPNLPFDFAAYGDFDEWNGSQVRMTEDRTTIKPNKDLTQVDRRLECKA